MAEVQEKQAEVLKERNYQASTILEELKVLKFEKKSLQDEKVLRKVDEMQKLLGLSIESSVPPDKTLGDLIDYFEKQHSLQVEASLKANNFTDEEERSYSFTSTKEDVLMLLKELVLENYYPQKMKTADFHMISRETLSGAQPLQKRELPIYFLQKLLVLDYGARYVHCENKSTINHGGNTSDPTGNHAQKWHTHFKRNRKVSEKQNAKHAERIHPMDVQMAIFHCADDFMRQNIYTKLSFCQFALPLLVPNPNTRSIDFPLWAFQEVKKKWKTKLGDYSTNKSNDKFIRETETPIVSFIRLGPSAFSKSQTINWLMSKHRHDIFFHRHCEGSTKTSILMDGVTEIAWYCPGGREDDVFDDCTAFVNLHGDVRDHGQQLEFILQISSVLVIVLTDSDIEDSNSDSVLDRLLTSTKPCVFLLVDEEVSESDNPQKCNIAIKGRNEAELIKEVRTKIQELIQVQKEVNSLNKCAALARSHGFIIDEDKEQCKVGKEQAKKLLKLLETEKLSDMKNTFLPLQGDLWKEQMCKKDKELRRLGGKSHLHIEQQKEDIESEKQALRREQLRRAYPLNNFMKDFLQFLDCNVRGSEVYFLQWFKMYLDELSSEVLSGLYQRYHYLWSDLKTKKQGDKNKEIIDRIEEKLQALSNEISLSTFGLEHVLRELGQIYEALEAKTRNKTISNLPKIAANLMICGNPIELMDGDAAHVPLKWITAILHELKNVLGDKKLFVLSVLGIQSTGKSTLLNAMFGLQFAVSAGRCTRGAFMQLVKIEEDLQKEMTYDYVLVVDTEGLMSAELSNQNALNHDNELATFVIGLGNLTLINIFGENSSEIQDIIQIAVQTFLRMKKINLHPSCLFVHQNVGEITAKEKNMKGRRCLQRKLDETTLCAAQQEECDATCFNDVIEFDVDSHIHYFAHLWEGDPPMAPPNPRYSQNVQTLRKVILDIGKEKESILSISSFSTRVTDLWEALLNENFVFSFKNSLEIAAYNKLEEMYSQWDWILRECMLTLQNGINNQIRNKEIKSTLNLSIFKALDEVYSKVQDEIKKFFNEDKDRNILVQWKVNTENRIATVKDKLVAEIKKKANELIVLKEKNREIDDKRVKYENEICAKSKELAVSLKGKKLIDKDLQEKFTQLWNDWISAVSEDVTAPNPPNIHRDLDEILRECFKTKNNIANRIQESYNWINLRDEFSNLVPDKHWYEFWKKNVSDDERAKVNNSITILTKRIDEYIDKKAEEKMDYQSSFFHEILKIIREEMCTTFEKKLKTLSDYIFCASLFLCRKAVHRFEKLSDAYRKANDPVLYLGSMRELFYKSFKISCEGKLEVTLLADIISSKLKVSFKQAVYEKSVIDVSRDMKCNNPAMNRNRSKLEFYLLKSLAEKEDFNNYLTYLKHPKSAVKEFIKECIEDYMEGARKMSQFLQNNVDEYKNIILNAINMSTLKIKKDKGNVDSWLKVFCSELENNLNLSHNDFTSVKYQNIAEIDFLKESMTQTVDTVVQMVSDEPSTCDKAELKKKILIILTDTFSGCWEKCPFCGAFCTNAVPEHSGDHSLQYHRPDGLKGFHNEGTKKLTIDICTSLVSSDQSFYLKHDTSIPYKSYRKAGPPYNEWSITPDFSSLSYWKWFTCRFQSDIEKYYEKTFENIPEQWKRIKKDDAIAEIEKLL